MSFLNVFFALATFGIWAVSAIHHTQTVGNLQQDSDSTSSCFYQLFLANPAASGFGQVTVEVDGKPTLSATLPAGLARSGWQVPVTAGQVITLNFHGRSESSHELWLSNADAEILFYVQSPLNSTANYSTVAVCDCDLPSGPEDCPSIRIRREWRSLSYCEQTNFLSALHAFRKYTNSEGQNVFDTYVKLHNEHALEVVVRDMLLPWHRLYLSNFENDIRAMGGEYSCVSVPYWDWSLDYGEEAVSIYDDFGSLGAGCMRDDFSFWWNPETSKANLSSIGAGADRYDPNGRNVTCVLRRWGKVQEIPFPPFSHTQFAATANSSYSFIHKYMLRYVHVMGHAYVGGSQGDMSKLYGSSDPMFWLHHSNMDRLFTLWQDCHDYDKTSSHLEYVDFSACGCGGLDDPMPYYNNTPRSTLDLDVFKYRYDAVLEDWHRWSDNEKCRWDWFSPEQQYSLLFGSSAPSSSSSSSSTPLPPHVVLRGPVHTSHRMRERMAHAGAVYRQQVEAGNKGPQALVASIGEECEREDSFVHKTASFMSDFKKEGIAYNIQDLCHHGLCRHMCRIALDGELGVLANQ